MNCSGVLRDAFGRIPSEVHDAVEGLTPEQLSARIDPDANSIAWLVWHLARVQDDHVAEVAGSEQIWTSHGWATRFGLPFDVTAIGYGQSSDDVGRVRVDSAELLTGYVDAVAARTTICRRSATQISTASSTSDGIHRSRSACGS